MSSGRNNATVGGTITRPPKAAAKLADPQTLAAALALAAAEADMDAEAAAEADADIEAEADADADIAAEAVALKAAEKLNPGDSTPNPKIDINSSSGVKRATASAISGNESSARTDSSKARFALSVGIMPASNPTEAEALRSRPSPAIHEA